MLMTFRLEPVIPMLVAGLLLALGATCQAGSPRGEDRRGEPMAKTNEVSAPSVLEAAALLMGHQGGLAESVAAAEVLGKSGDSAHVPLLVAQLETSSDALRDAAREALGKLGAPKLLVKWLASKDSGQQLAAVKGLRYLWSEKARPGLAELLGSVDAALRVEVAWTLSVHATDKDLAMLTRALDDPAADVRFWAGVGLAAVGGDAACSALSKRIAVEKDAEIKLELQQRLQRLQP